MISNLTEQQFRSLPTVALRYPCDGCGLTRDYGTLARALEDYRQPDGTLGTQGKVTYTALYLCSVCHWRLSCEVAYLERQEATCV